MSAVEVKDTVFEKFALKFVDKVLSLKNVVSVVLEAMEAIEQTQKQGAEKKEWVLAAVRKVIETNPLIGEPMRKALYQFCNSSLPTIIDTIVEVSKGVRNLNTQLKKCCSCC